MPNELDLSNPNFLDEMDEQQEEWLFQVMLAKRQQRSEQNIKRLFDVVEKQAERFNNEIETVKLETQRQIEDTERLLELERKRHLHHESMHGFKSQTDLGTCNVKVKIGPQKMGLLLKIVGLAKKSRKSPEPYDEYSHYAKHNPTKGDKFGRMHYLWNPEKTWSKIEDWLEQHGYIDEFYSCENKNEVHSLIDDLYEKYIGY